MPTPRRLFKQRKLKQRKADKGPAGRGFISKLFEKRNAGIYEGNFVKEHYRKHSSNYYLVSDDPVLGSEIRKALGVRKGDMLLVANFIKGGINGLIKSYIAVRASSQENKGARYFAITKEEPNGLFDKIKARYSIYDPI